MKNKLFSTVLLLSTVLFVVMGCAPVNQLSSISTNSTLNNDLSNNKFVLYNEKNLKKVKTITDDSTKKAIKKVTKQADNLLKEPTTTVTEKIILPKGGSNHDYASLSSYYWPDESKPNGMPYISHDGRKNPELKDTTKYDTERKDKMSSAVNTLCLSYYVTEKEEYASKAADFLRTWFINESTKMNPNLNYSQCVPGKNDGTSTGIIDSVPFIEITDSIRMLESSKSWTADDDKALKLWFSQYTDWLVNSSRGKGEAKAKNNHGVWYDAQVATYAYFTGNDALAKKTVEASKEKRIAAQIEPDGKMPLELSRTKSLDYTVYNLEAFISLARVGDRVGVDLWNYSTQDGRSIKKALDYLNSYIQEKTDWTYENIVETAPTQIAPYMAMANEHYNDKDFASSIEKLSPKINAQKTIMIYSLGFKN